MKRFLSLVLAMLIAITMLIIPASAENYATAVVKGGWLRLRAEASASSETISAYFTGTQVTIIGTSGEWYYVLTPDGHYGFMNSNYLTVTGSSSGSTTTESTAYIYAANGKPVRMRSGPSTDYGVIASYSVGTQVKVLISGADWSKIRVGTRTGYIMSKFLSVTNITPSTPSSSYTAYVTASNGKPVRMRTGAGTNYSVISTYSVGTQVTVLEYGKTWCRIRVNGYIGYMMTKFLTTTQPTIIGSAALNKNTVWPGETLTVTTNPANISVSYEWLNDAGARLGTGSTYTVKTSDTGRRIRVRVTGKNGTTGSVVSPDRDDCSVRRDREYLLVSRQWHLSGLRQQLHRAAQRARPPHLRLRRGHQQHHRHGDQRLHGHRDRRRNPVHRAEQRDPLQLLPDRRHGADGDHCPRERNRHHPLVP